MVEIHKVKITILRRFHPAEVFEKSPVTSETSFGACELFKEGQEFIVENMSMPKASVIPPGYQSTAMCDC